MFDIEKLGNILDIMRTAIVIPTRNAEKQGEWRKVLDAVAAQDLKIERKVIIDSSSDDSTCEIAESYGWECKIIKCEEFDHGLTRGNAVKYLSEKNIDTVIFLTQDVFLANPDALSEITRFLWNNPIAGCYGRQCGLQEHSLDAWQRGKCYPPESAIKSLEDIPVLGMMTPFFSNAFSAWKVAEVIRFGNFPETDFGEDMLLAAAVLNQNGKIGYCSKAVAVHSHSNTVRSLFARGRQVGSFHRKHPELLRQFKNNGGSFSLLSAPFSLWFALGVKITGYFWGYCFK